MKSGLDSGLYVLLCTVCTPGVTHVSVFGLRT